MNDQSFEIDNLARIISDSSCVCLNFVTKMFSKIHYTKLLLVVQINQLIAHGLYNNP